MKQYEIWWASLAAPVGRRPVLLLSRTSAYGYLSKVTVAEVTSTIRGIPQELKLGSDEGLESCVASFDNIHAVQKKELIRRIGRLAPARIVEVKRALCWAFDWSEFQ